MFDISQEALVRKHCDQEDDLPRKKFGSNLASKFWTVNANGIVSLCKKTQKLPWLQALVSITRFQTNGLFLNNSSCSSFGFWWFFNQNPKVRKHRIKSNFKLKLISDFKSEPFQEIFIRQNLVHEKMCIFARFEPWLKTLTIQKHQKMSKTLIYHLNETQFSP